MPHHLIDVVEPDEEFSLAQYRAMPRERTVAEIRGRGREVAVRRRHAAVSQGAAAGIFRGPAGRLDAAATADGRRGASRDPWRCTRGLRRSIRAAAARCIRNDTRRMIRALEVFEKTGQPISRLQQQFDVGRTGRRVPRVRARLAARRARLTGSTRASTRCSPPAWSTKCADCSRGRDAEPHGRAGRRLSRSDRASGAARRDLAETIELVKLRTRQFAKRQLTWFRSLSECRSVPVSRPFEPAIVAERIYEQGQAYQNARLTDVGGNWRMACVPAKVTCQRRCI